MALLMAAAMFSSCGEKEGVFNPERKLAEIVTTTTSVHEVRASQTDDWEYDTTYIYTNSEHWTWDNDHLANIRYDGDERLQFEYDGDRVTSITVQGYDQRIDIQYDGRKVKSIIMYIEGIDFAKATFSHEHGKVSCIEEGERSQMDYGAKALFRRIVGLDMIDETPASASNRATHATKDNTAGDQEWYSRWVDLEWDGDNIATATFYEESRSEPASAIRTYTYDNAHNPYSGMTYMGLCGSFVDQNLRLNANNIVRCVTTYKSGHSRTEEYSYTYDNGWPLSQTQVEVESYYLPAFQEYRQVTDTTVIRYTYNSK